MRFPFALAALFLAASATAAPVEAPAKPQPAAPASLLPARQDHVILVLGAPGTDEHGKDFAAQAKAWQTACAEARIPITTLSTATGDPAAPTSTLDQLRTALATAGKAAPAAPPSSAPLWLVLIGHGTFDGREAKLSLPGPDLTAQQLGQWLKPISREIIVVAACSASGPLLQSCAGPGRVIVTATKSGDEVFLTRFGTPFAQAIAGGAEADMDQDKQVSVLEAFLFASSHVAKFYETEERIATEHALLDDNGDSVGTRAAAFEGVRARDAATQDGIRAHELHLKLSPDEARLSATVRAERDQLERTIRALTTKRPTMPEADYYRELETLCVKIARLMTAPTK